MNFVAGAAGGTPPGAPDGESDVRSTGLGRLDSKAILRAAFAPIRVAGLRFSRSDAIPGETRLTPGMEAYHLDRRSLSYHLSPSVRRTALSHLGNLFGQP